MSKIDAKSLQLAFAPIGTPMLSQVIAQVQASTTCSDTRKRDMVSGLRRVAKAMGRAPEDVPADPTWLRKRIEKIAPAALGISAKTWANATSDARAALVLCGVVERRGKAGERLDQNWRKVWDAVLASGDRSLKPMSRFVYFLNRLGVAPGAVRDEHASAYLEALKANEIGKDPEVAYRAAVNMWNLAGARIGIWPKQRLTLPNRSKRIALDLASFPESFAQDIERFVQSLEAPDPFDALARSAPLRPQSVALYRRRMLRFASTLVHAGVDQATITGIAAVVTPANVERGLRHMLTANGNKRSREVSEMSGFLAKAARSFVRLGTEQQAEIDRLHKRAFLAPQRGMTAKNRDRLRALDDQAKLRNLLLLPERLLARGMEGTSHEHFLQREDAVAIALLLHCPIRRANAVSIHLDENLQRFGKDRAFLVFEPDEVKNSERIEFELPRLVFAMIDQHLAGRAPLLCSHGNPWLFPGRRKDGHLDPTHFAGRIKERIWKEVGVTVNAHLFRHIAAMLFLRAHPGQYEALRRLLGHKALTQTINAYAGFEAGTATRLFAEVLDEAKR